jgi:hypothetical protein
MWLELILGKYVNPPHDHILHTISINSTPTVPNAISINILQHTISINRYSQTALLPPAEPPPPPQQPNTNAPTEHPGSTSNPISSAHELNCALKTNNRGNSVIISFSLTKDWIKKQKIDHRYYTWLQRNK